MKNIIHGPATQAPKIPKPSPGVYNGEKGYPPRTSTPNGPPEKVRDNT